MTPSRTTTLLLCMLAAGALALLGGGAASALTKRAAPKTITPQGVGSVKLGRTYAKLRKLRVIGPIRPGCELAGPQARSASLRSPLKGSVDFTTSSPRKARVITIRGGATARGVGIGSTVTRLKQRFPKAVADHGTDATFAITLYTVPKNGGGRLQFAVDTTTKKVALIAIPFVPFCE